MEPFWITPIVTGLISGVCAGLAYAAGRRRGRKEQRALLTERPPIRRADPATKPRSFDKPAEGTRISTFQPTRRRHRGDLE